jgi:sodium-dependent dicarboxylate transporter 2/3/5
VAFCASLAMSLPISTPPNAIVYGTKFIKSHDMLLTGSLITITGLLTIFLAAILGIERCFSCL